VIVTWSGVPQPKEDDWLAVFSPSVVDLAAAVPIKYVWCKMDKKYLSTGKVG